MIKTLLLDTFLLMGIIWMLISIVYFCIRLDRLLSSMEILLPLPYIRTTIVLKIIAIVFFILHAFQGKQPLP